MTQLVVRQPSAPSVQQRPERAALSERLSEAQQIAKAGTDILPKQYRNNPGAVMLAMNWAEQHDVALLDAIANVGFIGGKPVVGARMQKELAARAGFSCRPTDEGPDHCTATVYDAAGNPVGSYTFTHEMAKKLDAYQSNPNYRKDLGQMLLHRATTRALDRYATGPGLGVIFSEPEDEQTPVEVLEQAAPVPTTDIDDICQQYELDLDATTETRAEAMSRGFDDLSALSDDEAAQMTAWIESKLGETS